ncbi:hypothetical protein DLM_0991 [Aquitalea magnusonii]|uniref:TonB C-terminal domain-containing protein n=1 Tax=Aquitalea magnusonii TaxID=332411 RepID=A0A3G9GEF4_9NEIS|nr:hypothetical protein [Aquitalea magnusonii]BBF84631.1 hypothetical protein DLM_0991 [Aquitalea magnusonii]
MKLPFGLRWRPQSWRWSALSEADRLMLALSLSLLLHAPLWMRLAAEGSLRGQPQALSVRLAGNAAPNAALNAPPVPPAHPVPRHPAPEIKPSADRVMLSARHKLHLPSSASAAQAQPPLPPHAVPQPEPVAASAPVMLLRDAASAPVGDDGAAQQLGLDFYYAARQVDVLALEQVPIQLVAPYGLGMDDVDITLRVYINEQGGVDAVQMVSARPAGAELPLMEIFRQASFYPAIRDGHAVKSFKLIRIGSQADGDTGTAPNN